MSVDERKVFHVVLTKQITVTVKARTRQHAKDIALDEDAGYMFQGQWLCTETEVVAIGTEQ
jgi:hypothetical protein